MTPEQLRAAAERFFHWLRFRRIACARCRGCGQLADCGWNEPWSSWPKGMPGEPIPCDACGGMGTVEIPRLKKS